MSAYLPPTDQVAIFDVNNFKGQDESLTYNKALQYFVRYPTAQGTVNLLETNVGGVLQCLSNVDINGLLNVDNNSQFNGRIQQNILNSNTQFGGGFSFSNNTTGYSNCAFGQGTLNANTTGYNNTAIGTSALEFNTTALNNTAVGVASLRNLTSNDSNVGVGVSTLGSTTNAVGCTAVGTGSLFYLVDNSNRCSALGFGADVPDTDNHPYQYLTLIGANSIPLAPNIDNQIVLGRPVDNVYVGKNLILPTAGGYIQFPDGTTQTTAGGGGGGGSVNNYMFYMKNFRDAYTPTIYINTSGATWGLNDFFTLKITISYNLWKNTTEAIQTNVKANTNATMSTLMDVYPYRIFTSSGLRRMTNDINGDGGYNANLSPYGRWWWFYNWVYNTNWSGFNDPDNEMPFYIEATSTDQTGFFLKTSNPDPYTGAGDTNYYCGDVSYSIQVLTKGPNTTATTITGSGWTYDSSN